MSSSALESALVPINFFNLGQMRILIAQNENQSSKPFFIYTFTISCDVLCRDMLDSLSYAEKALPSLTQKH